MNTPRGRRKNLDRVVIAQEQSNGSNESTSQVIPPSQGRSRPTTERTYISPALNATNDAQQNSVQPAKGRSRPTAERTYISSAQNTTNSTQLSPILPVKERSRKTAEKTYISSENNSSQTNNSSYNQTIPSSRPTERTYINPILETMHETKKEESKSNRTYISPQPSSESRNQRKTNMTSQPTRERIYINSIPGSQYDNENNNENFRSNISSSPPTKSQHKSTVPPQIPKNASYRYEYIPSLSAQKTNTKEKTYINSEKLKENEKKAPRTNISPHKNSTKKSNSKSNYSSSSSSSSYSSRSPSPVPNDAIDCSIATNWIGIVLFIFAILFLLGFVF